MLVVMEQFKDIIGYYGYYQISNYGNVKSLDRLAKHSEGNLRKVKGKTLKLNTNTKGYYTVNLNKEGSYKTRTIHQLVAESFLDHIPCGYNLVIDHIDNNKLNNRVDNLQLISNRENSSKDRNKFNKTSKYVGVIWHKHNKKWAASIRINKKRKYIGYFKIEEDAYNAYQKELINL